MHKVTDDAELQTFIDRCQFICYWHDKPPWDPDIRVFNDGELEIKYSRTTEFLEITLLPALHPDNLHNPVVHITVEGELIRQHGEWRLASEKVEALHEDCELGKIKPYPNKLELNDVPAGAGK